MIMLVAKPVQITWGLRTRPQSLSWKIQKGKGKKASFKLTFLQFHSLHWPHQESPTPSTQRPSYLSYRSPKTTKLVCASLFPHFLENGPVTGYAMWSLFNRFWYFNCIQGVVSYYRTNFLNTQKLAFWDAKQTQKSWNGWKQNYDNH